MINEDGKYWAKRGPPLTDEEITAGTSACTCKSRHFGTDDRRHFGTDDRRASSFSTSSFAESTWCEFEEWRTTSSQECECQERERGRIGTSTVSGIAES